MRVVLIRTGKTLPFILCFMVFVSYTETAFALALGSFSEWNGYIIPYKPVSWFLGQYFEYNIQMLLVLTITSIATNTCVWNKLACLYLAVNLIEKYWLESNCLQLVAIGFICFLNMTVSSYITYKGIKALLK